MKRPFDLVAFLEQEKRVDRLEHFKSREDIAAARHWRDDPPTDVEQDAQLESRFFAEDEDCQNAGQPLAEFDLFVSTHIHPDRDVPGVK